MTRMLAVLLLAAAASAAPFFEAFSVPVPQKPDKRAIYDQHPFAWNGMPAISRVPDGRIFMAWIASRGFAGGGRIVAAYSNDNGRTWGYPLELINNPDRDDGDPTVVVDGGRVMVISTSIRLPERFDKFNIFPIRYDRAWWWMTGTEDGGRSWSKPVLLDVPHAYPGKHSNGLRLKDGTLVIPYYYDVGSDKGTPPPLERDSRALAGMMRSTDHGRTWQPGQTIRIRGASDTEEPAAVILANGDLFCLLRNLENCLYETRSRDGGITWSDPRPTMLTARNSPLALYRLQDAPGDELVVVWNNVPDRRFPLVAAYSPDGGRHWSHPKVLSNPNPAQNFRADNPSITQAPEGTILVVWHEETLPRHLGKELRVARFNREWLRQ